MEPATMTQIVTALTIIAKTVETLGAGGIVALALAGPVAVVLTVIVLSWISNNRLTSLVESYREDGDKRFDQYRERTDAILKQYGESLATVSQYYKDNVELVKGYDRIASDAMQVISLNTRVMQQLVDKIDSNWFCPHVKKEAQGK